METKLDNNKKNLARKLSFPLGAIDVTDRAWHTLGPTEIITAVTRHARGDWGDLDDEQWKLNDLHVDQDVRLISKYTARSGPWFWVLTEADRSSTTVLLLEDLS